MDNKEIKTLAKYRLEQAKENLEEAEALFDKSRKIYRRKFIINSLKA